MSANNPKQPAEPVQSDREAAAALLHVLNIPRSEGDMRAASLVLLSHRRDHVRKVLDEAAKWTTDGYRCRSCGTVFLSEDGNRCCDRPNWDKLTEDQVAAAIRSMKQEVK